jgi:hypothetical protein
MINDKIIKLAKRAQLFIYVNYDDRNSTEALEIIEELKELQKPIEKISILNNELLPNDSEIKSHIDSLPYYGSCTSEFNEGFEDGVNWLKDKLTKNTAQ